MQSLSKTGVHLSVLLSLFFWAPSLLWGADLIPPSRSLGNTPQSPAELRINSEPANLDVKMDGKLIGTTPLKHSGIDPGRYLLEVEKTTASIDIEAGQKLIVYWFKGRFIVLPEDKKKAGMQTAVVEPTPSKPEAPPSKSEVEDLTPWELFVNGTHQYF